MDEIETEPFGKVTDDSEVETQTPEIVRVGRVEVIVTSGRVVNTTWLVATVVYVNESVPTVDRIQVPPLLSAQRELGNVPDITSVESNSVVNVVSSPVVVVVTVS